MATYLATVTLESRSDKSSDKNDERLDCALAIADRVASSVPGDCVVLFPGGWFHTGSDPADSIIPSVTAVMQKRLATYPNNLVLAFGIDGLMTPKGFDRDQLGLAVGRQGLLALGRKFHLSRGDKQGNVIKAENYRAREQGYDRVFTINDHRFFIAVCYDIKGFVDLHLGNPGADVVLNMVHFYYLCKEEPELCGVGNFTRKIVPNASRYAECPVFNTAVFVRRNITPTYRTGLYCLDKKCDLNHAGADDHSLRPVDGLGFRQPCPEGAAEIRVYDLDRILTEPGACRYDPGEHTPRTSSERRSGMQGVKPHREPGAFDKVREKVIVNGAGEVFDTLVEGMTQIFGDDRHDQQRQVTFFGLNRVDYPGVDKIDLVMLLSHHAPRGTLKVKVYSYAIAALYRIDEAEIQRSLPSSFEETSYRGSEHPKDKYLTGELDQESAARFVTAMKRWASAPGD